MSTTSGHKMNRYFRWSDFRDAGVRGLQRGRGVTAVFGPGVFFILLGAVTLFAPGLLLAAIAALFVFVGVLFCVLAVKFVQLKRKVDLAVQNFPGRIYVQGVSLGNPVEFEVLDDDEEDEDDTIIIH